MYVDVTYTVTLSIPEDATPPVPDDIAQALYAQLDVIDSPDAVVVEPGGEA